VMSRIEIDAMAWRPNWEMTPRDELRVLVDTATQGDDWVIDGNYSAVREIVWPKLDTAIWLDYRFPRVFGQLLLRTIRRSATPSHHSSIGDTRGLMEWMPRAISCVLLLNGLHLAVVHQDALATPTQPSRDSQTA